MNRFDDILTQVLKHKSTIPRNSLDTAVFQYPDEYYPILQPFIKVQISNDVQNISTIIPVTNCYIVGDILTRKWNPQTPIDVIMEMEDGEMPSTIIEVVMQYLKSINGRMAAGTQHPISYFVVKGTYNTDDEPGVYSVADEKWIKEPNLVRESIIDYAHKTLSPYVWDVDQDPPTLRPDVKNKIILELKKYFGTKLSQFAKEIHITGSIGTQQWSSTTDIDVHLVPGDLEERFEEYSEIAPKIRTDFKNKDIRIGKHPMEVYIQLHPDQESRGDASYDVLNDTWIKAGFELEDTFDPGEEFKHLKKHTDKIFANMDLALGELRRDLIDYDLIKDYLSNLEPGEKTWLAKMLRKKLLEIENDIELLIKQKEKYHQLRNDAYDAKDEMNAWNDVIHSKSWSDPNITWKMLDRYRYVALILALQTILDDDKITPADIDEIEKVVNFKEHREHLGMVTELRKMKPHKRWKDPLARHALVMARGMNRKNMLQIPNSSRVSHAALQYPFSTRIMKIAKKSPSGIWKLSHRQLLEIVEKYGLKIPDQGHPFRRLGKTGIILYRQNPINFYLIKNDIMLRKLRAKTNPKKV